MTLSFVFVFKLISMFNSQNPKFSFMHACVDEGYSGPMTIACKKQI